jgi:hypothetical protein
MLFSNFLAVGGFARMFNGWIGGMDLASHCHYDLYIIIFMVLGYVLWTDYSCSY